MIWLTEEEYTELKARVARTPLSMQAYLRDVICNIQPKERIQYDLFETPDVLLALSLLSTVDNPHRDVPLVATLYSPIFSYTMDELIEMLRDEIAMLLNVKEGETSDDLVEPFDFSKKPYVIMVVGVNGVGKTTTIGKLASKLQAQGKKVVVGAADTFRAAAVDQLTIWAERAGVDIVKQEMGSDPASVAFDTLKSAVAKPVVVTTDDT